MARGDKGSGATPARPRKQRFAQLRQVYGMAKQDDPRLALWLALIVVGVILLCALIGAPFGHPFYAGFIGLFLGVAVAMFFLGRRAEAAAYRSIEGRPGSGGAAFQGLRRGWSYGEEPVAVESRSRSVEDAAMVYRAVGRPGVVLVGEGPRGRATKLLESERKKVLRLVPNVPVTSYRVGTDSGEDALSTREVVKRMKGLKNELTKHEVTVVDQRLRSLARARPPIPAGMDPQRARQMGRGQRR